MRRLADFLRARPFRTVVIVLGALLLLGNRGFRSLISRAIELRRLRREMVSLNRQETVLAGRIRDMRRDDYAMERVVRKELDYLKPGEIEYRFPPPKPESSASASAGADARP